MRSAILTGLCYKNKDILHKMWSLLEVLGPTHGLKTFLDKLPSNMDNFSIELQTLILFCDCMAHFITILDDVEMYEKQDPFKLSEYVDMSYFLNYFLYKSITNNLIDLEKGRNSTKVLLSKMPHILPHSERVLLFRKYVMEDKATLKFSAIGSTLISVHRSKIVDDGYRQLSILSPEELKSVIRVRFINEQGLDEAGIDQDGVFKEFLEETIKQIFNPSLNLFKVTCENRLYPSSSSFLQDNHLLLFEFIGRLLGKAVYEGIVVDIPFASFFVSQFCGLSVGALYSHLDELASLDNDLYRSLTLLKHYEGDITDLELTFSFEENVMGKLVNHELRPGGRVVTVTNDNKIHYIHLIAQFRMYMQIKDQIAAFTKGFRSIIKPNWLSLFSSPEWQRLISGDNVPLDLRDLRKHTQYYGGFHDKHRVICWLWDILDKDFSEKEKGLFLKFVTSCSKSPLLGFAYLEPPFSIRCIEVADDEDTGDTIAVSPWLIR
ncbi:ubiquitin-protein ligase E3B [Copidosoma floridanum]|uniref:ubiquitin-protein ligase E3B n=1 Tax=Copidosoma floridanum TaxID=29053 RepID=UPI0006C93CBF|nr:ubiquitin-protein ligase E3B [Copidosoma floridanum]